jgi:hypothetical protein
MTSLDRVRAVLDRFEQIASGCSSDSPWFAAADMLREALDEQGDFRCICGSGDDAALHSLLCAASNTPDEVWASS